MNYSAAFFDHVQREALASAEVVVPYAIELVRPGAVVDVGCGTGAWLSVFRHHGVQTIVGLDGAYLDRSKLMVPPDCFRAVDLAKPFHLSDRFDLAISLEVAEHLPETSAEGFVKSLCQLAPIILFSAAIPGQTGNHHINEQWPEYWQELFAAENFRAFDYFRPMLWQDQRVALWYRQNMFLYVENDVFLRYAKVLSTSEVSRKSDILLIDANMYFGLKATLRRLPLLVAQSFRRQLQHIRCGLG